MSEDLHGFNCNISSEDLNTSNKHVINDYVTTCGKNVSDSDSDNEIRIMKCRSKMKRDTNKENDLARVNTVSLPQKSDLDDSNDEKIYSNKKKSRIKRISNSDSESENHNAESTSKYDLTRTKIRSKDLHDKFKKLKHSKSIPKENTCLPSDESDSGSAVNSSDGAISCSKIKQKLKKKTSHTLTAICDPDTSEEENNHNVKLQKSKPRSTKLISPKAVRMSAKQAMENMQKIKSESNRMLREKQVSLPYHRPKALTLKDIMNRRKPAVSSDGKSLPIKMNEEQLKQYALLLEQRQKEIMELCKSDTDEEEQEEKEQICTNSSQDDKEVSANETTLNQENADLSDANDLLYDSINIEHDSTNKSKDNSIEENIKEPIIVTETLEENGEESASNYNRHEKVEIENEVKEQTNDMDLEKTDLHSNCINKISEQESQIISLHFDSERTAGADSQQKSLDILTGLKPNDEIEANVQKNTLMTNDESEKKISDEFSDDDFTLEGLEEIIENAEVIKDKLNKPLSSIGATLQIKPMLTGTPGMVIDLDDDGEDTQKKLTGVELLKERFKYFSKLKSLEDMEKDREKKFKPGIQHLKLKQELEEQIAEQRSLEWEKRLQVENQLKAEMNTVEGEEYDGENIEKIEAKLEESVMNIEEESSSEEEMEDTEVYDVKDKPRMRNPLIDDEAEVSEDEDVKNGNEEDAEANNDEVNNTGDDDEDDSQDEDDEDSSESEEEEQQTKPKKGRILKAFEDSDDEQSKTDPIRSDVLQSNTEELRESQDDEIQLAQPQKTYSDDLFTTQECTQKSSNVTDEPKAADTSLEDLGSQTFSILKSANENISDRIDVSSEKIDVVSETQPGSDDNFDAIVGMCTAGFSQNLVTPPAESSQLSQSQEISDDVVALCTGKFYDNPFVSQADDEVDVENKNDDKSINELTPIDNDAENRNEDKSISESSPQEQVDNINLPQKPDSPKPEKVCEGDNKLLKSILEELDDPEFDSPKPNKYFFNAVKGQDKENAENLDSTQFKKKFVIESDDEVNENSDGTGRKKKRKKRKLENRALQISDDEEEFSEPEQEIYESDIEEDNDRHVEYDSEENEVEIQAKVPKKKRVGRDFFEQEAELTSEDEWIGSGDEDEAGLDRMEREAGDDDTFHQGKLQRELGEIHMRDVLDQDKREVRLLQELFFEDGDLGDGHRQRKFRWRNADGEEELGTNVDEYADTQEDEFESEEQWRKQRHEREIFLRKLQEKDGEDANVSINRSAFIKATLASKAAPGKVSEKMPDSENNSSTENEKSLESNNKKTAYNIPSPKKPFVLLKQNYHNSLLTRGRGALARLAALATPLAGDGDDAPKVNASSSRGNFVFAAITPEAKPKGNKRKADTVPDTPKLLKKMKLDSSTKSSLLDHL